MYSLLYNEHPPIKKNIFITLMHLSTQGMFLYNNRLHQQLDGVAMGCLLASTTAYFLSGHMETIKFKKYTPDHSIIYDKYKDDIF